MNTSAILAQYLSVKSEQSYNTLQQMKWSGLHSAMTEKLSTQSSAASKWESASMTIIDQDGEKNISKSGTTYCTSGQTIGTNLEKSATLYASVCVPTYDPDKLDEYTELDMQYDLMQNTYDTLLEQLDAQAESLQSRLSTASQDTGMLE